MGVVPTGLVASCSTLDHSIASAMGSFLCPLLLETASIRIQDLRGTQWIFSSLLRRLLVEGEIQPTVFVFVPEVSEAGLWSRMDALAGKTIANSLTCMECLLCTNTHNL